MTDPKEPDSTVVSKEEWPGAAFWIHAGPLSRMQDKLAQLTVAAEFLLERLPEFEAQIEGDDLIREWDGHVIPAIARLRAALAPAKP